MEEKREEMEMGTKSLQAAAPARRRSFNLPSFRKSSAPERQEVLKDGDEMPVGGPSEEAARTQKAAAWQWFTRGVGEAVVLTPTRPRPVGNAHAPARDDKSCIGARGPRSKDGQANVCDNNIPQKRIVKAKLAESHTAAASRFKAEADLSFTRPGAAKGGAPPAVPAPSAPSGAPSTPLYDEFELSGLRTHMADLVQRLRPQHTPDNEQSSPAVGDHGRSMPQPPPLSIDHHQTNAPPAVAVASLGDHQVTKPVSSPAPVASAIPFLRRPFSALQKLFRKVLSGSVPKTTKNSSQIIDSAPAVYEPAEMLYNNAYSTTECHHHHYIHHHHHHYHSPRSPEEQASIILSRRRHSESGSSRPCTPSLVEADSDEDEDEAEAEESRIAAYLARIRRRRHSDSFPKYQLRPENAGFDNDVGMKEAESPKVGLPIQFSRRYDSERFLPSKIPAMGGKDNTAQLVEDEFDEGTFAGIRRRRRLSAELHREEPSLERTGGKTEGGTYKLGGAGAVSGTPASMRMGRRRHSESSTVRPEAGAKGTPSPGRPYRVSPSARYYVHVQERQFGVPTLANAATAGFYAA